MDQWDFTPPTSSAMGDHDVPLDGEELTNCRIGLMISGSIAAFTTPYLARALRRRGARVQAFCSGEALRYVTEESLEWATTNPVITSLGADAEHLSDAAPFDLYLVAPATYNTIGKMARGIADTVLTAALASAIGRMERGEAAVLVAPTMHGTMHTSMFVENCRMLDSAGVRIIPPRDDYGKHNLPREEVLVGEVIAALVGRSAKSR
ncbi:MAG: flavoprotein [Planctomycetota bacterium]|nr:flavoprotein [Planctomycetota bacterium]